MTSGSSTLRLQEAVRRSARRARPAAQSIWTFVLYASGRFSADNCFQAAAALTFTTLLALVPLVTIMVGFVPTFLGVETVRADIQSLVFRAMVPEVGVAVLEQVTLFAENTARLTSIGIIGLLVTAFMLLATIESAFNQIWRVRVNRHILTRLLSFWAILTLTPVLAAFGLSLTVEAFQEAPFEREGGIWWGVRLMIPPLLEFVGLVILFVVIPNRDVRWRDAAVGAALATAMFEAAKWGFGLYITLFPTYQTIYGALAIIPIFLIWLYLTWSIVLIGALTTAALPDWRAGRINPGAAEPDAAVYRLYAAVGVIHALRQANREGLALRRRTLLKSVPMSALAMDELLEELREAHYVEQTQQDHWLLARDPDSVTLWDLSRKLGLGIEMPERFVHDGADWGNRLLKYLTEAEQRDRAVLDIPLSRVVDDPTDERPPSAERTTPRAV